MSIAANSNVVQTLSEIDGIVENLLLLLTDKEKVVIQRRFNLDNKKKSTLESLGKEFSVTRERIRQIEKNALAKMKRNVFNTSLKHLHEYSSLLIKDNGGLLSETETFNYLRSLCTSGINFSENPVRLCLHLQDNIDCEGNTITFYPFVHEKNLSANTLKYISNQIINQMQKYGDVKSLSDLNNDLRSLFDTANFDIKKIKSLVNIDKRLVFLENEMLGLLEWPHVNPRTLREKILFILRDEKKPMHFSDVSLKISQTSFNKRPVNIQAVHNELIRHDQFVLIGRGIYALKEWGYEEGTVVEVIKRILKEKGEMSVDDIVNEVLKQRQIKRITILLALKDNSTFVRVGRKRYRLL